MTPPAAPPYQQPVSPVAAPQKTNGFAIASLIFGIIGGILFAVIFGFVALSQIKKRGDKGKGMAIAGIALSGVWLLLICGGIALAIAIRAERDDAGNITEGGSVGINSIKIGDCIVDAPEGDYITGWDAVPCAEPHDAEVVGDVNVTGHSTYPGQDAIDAAAEKCYDRWQAYDADSYEDESLDIYYAYPTKGSWRQGDRTITCMVYSLDGKLTGSIKN